MTMLCKVYRPFNNKGLPLARPWAVFTAHGGYVASFETEYAADFFIEDSKIGRAA